MADIADLFAMLAVSHAPEEEEKASEPTAELAVAFREAALAFIASSPDETSGRYADYLRASGLGNVCGRAEGIMRTDPQLRVSKKRGAGGVMTVHVGHVMHSQWQNRYAGPLGWLWGKWICLRCSPVVEGEDGRPKLEPVHTGLMPERCPGCDAPRAVDSHQVIAYDEMAVFDHDLRYSGHPDGLLVVPWREPDDRVLFEFKTIKTDRYESLRAPHADYVDQMHAYMRLLGVDEALIVYADKGSQCKWRIGGGRYIDGDARLKVFHVHYDEGHWAGVAERIRNHWLAVAGTDPRQLPRICRTPSCMRARLCTARERCFSLREDGV